MCHILKHVNCVSTNALMAPRMKFRNLAWDSMTIVRWELYSPTRVFMPLKMKVEEKTEDAKSIT